MEKPKEAIFNSVRKEWELEIKTGEWKYWSAATGDYCCHTSLNEATNVLSVTRFHPDGTYSYKATLIGDVPQGKVYHQKSEHPTTETALTKEKFANVFRVVYEYVDGKIVWKEYFNKEDEQVDLNGDSAVTMAELATCFSGHLMPGELLSFLLFENDHGAESYAQTFHLYAGGKPGISTWSEDPDFLQRLMPFASADGSIYAIWDDGSGKAISKMPVVLFGDEGGVDIVAKNILELMHLLTYDSYICRNYLKEIRCQKSDDDDPSPYAAAYKKWMKKMFHLDEIVEPDAVIKSAQDEFKASFDAWFKKYVS